MLEKNKRSLCVREERYGTIDLWINNEEHWYFDKQDKTKWQIIATYNGEDPSKGEAFRFTFDVDPTKALDELMSHVGRDTENWYYKDIVIHWGVHTWKFVNNKNLDTVERDEYCKDWKDIPYYYDVEW